MLHLLFNLFLVALGAGLGITVLCLVQAGHKYDKQMDEFERRKEK